MAGQEASGRISPSRTEEADGVSRLAELAGGLAHELRNPLSTMMINLKLLAEDLDDLSAHPEHARRRARLKVDGLQHEAQRLQTLFDEFLNLAGPLRLERAERDLCEVITRLAEFYEPQATARGLRVEVACPDEPVLCPVDEQRLRQAMLNIILNAEQAMPKEGLIRLQVKQEDDQAIIAVSDTGVGIDPADLERIYRPFFSTKASGSGLGLSITRRIVRAHGGELDCRSVPGEGTTFVIRLPLRPEAPPSPNPDGAPGD